MYINESTAKKRIPLTIHTATKSCRARHARKSVVSASSAAPPPLLVALATISVPIPIDTIPARCEFGSFLLAGGRPTEGRSSHSLSWKNARTMLYSLTLSLQVRIPVGTQDM